MSRTYTYFVASLPYLRFDGKLTITTEQFLQDAQRLLAPADALVLTRLLSDEDVPSSNPVIQAWVRFNQLLKNEAVLFRASRLNKDPQPYLQEEYHLDTTVKSIIQNAGRASDPLEGERIISKAKWQFLTDLTAGEFFNLEYLMTYGLKLKILQRYHQIESPKGKEIYVQAKKMHFPEEIEILN